jgi:hypothetical protein
MRPPDFARIERWKPDTEARIGTKAHRGSRQGSDHARRGLRIDRSEKIVEPAKVR